MMELVEGADLADGSRTAPCRSTMRCAIARQIADALEAAHEQGIIHRDLKPANVKVRDDGAVKVLDFGLAKAWRRPARLGRSAQSLSPTITPPTMTERADSRDRGVHESRAGARQSRRQRTDIWAFGCVLFEMFTGTRAFEGDDVSPTLAAVLERDVILAALPAGSPRRPPCVGVACGRSAQAPARRSPTCGSCSKAPCAAARDDGAPRACVRSAPAVAARGCRFSAIAAIPRRPWDFAAPVSPNRSPR